MNLPTEIFGDVLVVHAPEEMNEEQSGKFQQFVLSQERVKVVVDLDSGETPVEGRIRHVDAETISILREDPRVGTVCVHFPRVGYRVTPV